MNKEKLISILKYVAAVIVILSMFVIIFYQNRDRDIFKFGKEESSQIIAANQENLSGDAFAKSDVQRIGDTTVVCWAEGADPAYRPLLLGALFGNEQPEWTEKLSKEAL